jgi:MFS family permease
MVGTPSRRLTAGLMCGVSVHAMQAYAVATALPTLTKDLGGRGSYATAITVYLLASLVGLADGGRRVDHIGIRSTVRAGALWITAGLFCAALAPSMPLLYLGRVFQGFGAGLLTTVVYAIVHTAYPRAGWPKMLALLSAAWAVSGVALPGLLGYMVEAIHWRVVFVAPLPVLAATIAWILPSVPDHGEPGDEPAESVRVRDAVGVVVGAVLALHPIVPSMPAITVAQALLGVVIAIACLRRLMPEGTLTLRPVLGGAIGAKFLVCLGFFGAEVFLPLALEAIHHRSPAFVGFVMTSATLAWALAAFVQSRILERVGPARCASVGSAMIVMGVAGLLLLTDSSMSPYIVFAAWGLAAAGMGTVYSTTTDSAMAATAIGREGATGTALGIADVLGAAIGAGLGQLLLASFPSTPEGVALGLRGAWGMLAILTLPAVYAASRLGAEMVHGRPEAAIAIDTPAPDAELAAESP